MWTGRGFFIRTARFSRKFRRLKLVFDRPAQQLVEHLLRRGALIEDVVYRPADRQLHPVFLPELTHGAHGVISLGEVSIRLTAHKGFTKLAVMTVGGEDRRLIVAQMTQTIGRQLTAAHRADEPRHLARSTAHEGTLQAREPLAVEHARRDADDVLRRRADLVADEIRPVVKADEVARERLHEPLLRLHVVAVDDHAVRDAAVKLLHMPRPQPDGDPVRRVHARARNLAQAAARSDLESLHAQNERLAAQPQRPQLPEQRAQPLRADGDDDDLRLLRRAQVGRERDGRRQLKQIVFPRLQKALHPRRARAAVECDLMADAVEIPRNQRAPAPAANHRNFHGKTSFRFRAEDIFTHYSKVAAGNQCAAPSRARLKRVFVFWYCPAARKTRPTAFLGRKGGCRFFV